MKPKTIIIITAGAAFALYLIAYGPLYRAWVFGNTPDSIRGIIETAYAPLWWAADHSELIGNAIRAYGGWWCETW